MMYGVLGLVLHVVFSPTARFALEQKYNVRFEYSAFSFLRPTVRVLFEEQIFIQLKERNGVGTSGIIHPHPQALCKSLSGEWEVCSFFINLCFS